MKIEKCKIKIKCDVGGCCNMADKSISFDGVTTQFNLCDDCLNKFVKKVIQTKGGKTVEKKSSKG